MEKDKTIKQQSSITVLGGTFDPVHHGHLRLAIDLAETLQVEEVRLMPGYKPVHRTEPGATANERLKMLQLAVEDNDELSVDDREILRQGSSYTVLSLKEIREEVGDDTTIYFILGEDAFNHFDTWYKWQDITRYAHLLIAIRPGHELKLNETLEEFLLKFEFQGEGFPTTPAGNLIRINNAMLEISSSDIRQRLLNNRSIRYLLPARVLQYINEQNLYVSEK